MGVWRVFDHFFFLTSYLNIMLVCSMPMVGLPSSKINIKVGDLSQVFILLMLLISAIVANDEIRTTSWLSLLS